MFTVEDIKYLTLLSKFYPNIDSVSTKIINLQAILDLPKGTEHFVSDIHGEYESFLHVLKNGSGVIREKIQKIFGNEITETDKRELASLVYYPKEKLSILKETKENITEWYPIALYRLIKLCKAVTDKYTRTKVRHSLPKEFSYILEELLYETSAHKGNYYQGIINTIVELDKADSFIIAISELMQRFAIARLHVIGDIYDRGPGAEIIMDRLINYHSIDIQWGNHDILWMGAAAGSLACIANVVRLSLRYGNVKTLEEGYGISLRPLSIFAYDYYDGDPALNFVPKKSGSDKVFSDKEIDELTKMHKSIAIIQFKLETEIIKRNPQWKMTDRNIIESISADKKTVTVEGKTYPISDSNLPTINPENPAQLNEDEWDVILQLKNAFLKSGKLQKHAAFLYSEGSLYRVFNNNLLFHGAIPLDKDGNFKNIVVKEKTLSGKELMDEFEHYAVDGYFSKSEPDKKFGEDLLWYLWAGTNSPLFGKTKMATFERYFINDKETHIEGKNYYYNLRENREICEKILEEFSVPKDNGRIINGHVPVKVKHGESPLKSDGKLIVIDGGFSKAYQTVTGIAGYTLIYNSQGIFLVSHEPFKSTKDAIENGTDIHSTVTVVEHKHERILVRDTETGINISSKIFDLKNLLTLYRQGVIKEKTS